MTPQPVTGIADFLAARLDEDEKYARTMIEVGERQAAAATPKDMADIYGLAMGVLSDPQVRTVLERCLDGAFEPPNDLRRVLREVAFKRAILAEHEPEPWGDPHPGLLRCAQGHGDEYWTPWPCAEVRALTAVYSGRPGYRQEWA
jgi:hypothetical protein